MDTVRNGTFGLSNTNKLVRFYQGCTGLKTGFTSAAGHCLSASALRDGMELIAVVLGAENSQARFAACKQMLDYGFANFAVVTPALPENPTVPVKLGTEAWVSAVPAQLPGFLIDKAQRGYVTTTTTLEPMVTAPVSQGQKLGTLQVKVGEQVLAQIPLVAAQAVPRQTWQQIFTRILRQITMAA
jgi:D-alanyl-D-alanine carboxypeptidase (penicillin-binding protein 5/6)